MNFNLQFYPLCELALISFVHNPLTEFENLRDSYGVCISSSSHTIQRPLEFVLDSQV